MLSSRTGHYQLTISSSAVKRVRTYHPGEGEVPPAVAALSTARYQGSPETVGLEGRAVQGYVDRVLSTQQNQPYVQDITSCAR